MAAPIRALAYHLPACSISDKEKTRPAEEILLEYKTRLEDLANSVDVTRLEEHRRNTKIRLAPKERRAAKEYHSLVIKIDFWEQIQALKESLSALHGNSSPPEAISEADAIAKDVIDTLYALSQKWRIGSSALFTNFLINSGFKEKGFCYHYVAALRKVLQQRPWNQFEIRWGTAWEDTFRENNALVITARGRAFAEGLAIDAWRTAGRPFWTPVKNDRFPWVEAFSVEAKYELE